VARTWNQTKSVGQLCSGICGLSVLLTDSCRRRAADGGSIHGPGTSCSVPMVDPPALCAWDARRTAAGLWGGRHSGVVTTGTATVVERTRPAILAALQRQAPHEAAWFESELRGALDRAGTDLDVTPVDEVMARWHTRACILANPLTEQEQALLARARAGDFAGLRARDENGGWTTL